MSYEYFDTRDHIGDRVVDSGSGRHGKLLGRASGGMSLVWVLFDGEKSRVSVEKRYLKLLPTNLA